MTKRPDTPKVADEREMLTCWLDWQRATLAEKCEGLTAEQLCLRAVPGGSLSLLGLVRHMAEVERGWFRRGLAREGVAYRFVTEEDEDADFNDLDPAGVDEAFAAWGEEIDRARAITAETESLDETFTRHRTGDVISLRWVLVHMIEEYARHNGHADLLRERIDGVTGS